MNKGKLKQFIGMDKALTVRFILLDDGKVSIDIGEKKWADKGAVIAVSMFVLWPLAISGGIGIYKQKKLSSKIICIIDEYCENRDSFGPLEPDKEKNRVLDPMTKERLAYASQKILPKLLEKLIR